MKKNMLSQLILESESYSSLEKIEQLIDGEKNLNNIPIHPLYTLLKKMSPDQLLLALPLLSEEQKKVFWDLDLWEKDEINIEKFEFWIELYGLVNDQEQIFEFVSSSAFGIYLKAKFNIWTFDLEDPLYPDHDYYFLTDDQLLLFEFDESFSYAEEIKKIIQSLYSEWGVEKAYAFLFKLTSDSFSSLSEEEYFNKKSRLEDYGLIDYFDALKMLSPLRKFSDIEPFIVKKRGNLTPEIDPLSRNQILSEGDISIFKKNENSLIFQELDKIDSEKRLNFLHFDFIRTLNAYFALRPDFSSSIEKGHNSQEILNILELGLSYLENYFDLKNETPNLFDEFNFHEIFKIGYSLIKIQQKEIENIFKITDIEERKFIGEFLEEFLEMATWDLPKFYSWKKIESEKKEKKSLSNFNLFQDWEAKTNHIKEIFPFIKSFYETYCSLKKNQNIQDSYYLNYSLDEIDFESLLLSTFVHFVISRLRGKKITAKIGLSLDEVQMMFDHFFLKNEKGLFELIDIEYSSFEKAYGFEIVQGMRFYLREIFENHLSGHDNMELNLEDYKFIGGVIILKS